MLEEKFFRKLVIAIMLILILFVAFSYGMFYKKQPTLEVNNEETISKKTNNMPVELFQVFSMTKDDLKIKLGDPKQAGDDSDYDNKYLDYSQTWFGKSFVARYYYGDYSRMYQTNLKMKNEDVKSVYEEMKIQLGEPVVDTFFDSKIEDLDMRITYWVKDSVRYAMVYDESVPFVKMKLEYYKNPDNHKVGERPIIIQRMDKVTNLVDGESVSVLLVGEKPEYTSTYYKHVYVIVGTKNGSYLGKMPNNNDGGFAPNFTIKSINGVNTILVETDNEYTKWYVGFEFKDKKLNSVYSSEKSPN